MPYVKHIRSNFKGGVDSEIGYRTLILGINGSGKSALTTSIEYALSGKVSDVVGRSTVADVNQLLTLGPGDSIFAEATLSDDAIIRCETKGKKSSAPAHPTAFPLREVRDALSGSVETVRKFFLRMTSGAVSRADVEAQIPGPYRELFGEVIAPTRADTPAVDLLLYALEKAKARARELASEAKAAGNVAAETTMGLEPVAASDLENARESLTKARAEVTELMAALNRARQVVQLMQEGETAYARVTSLAAQLTAIPPPAEADRVREELWALLQYAESKGLATCPCCRGVAVSWTERLASVAAKRTERARELERYNAARAALDVAEQAHAQAVARAHALGIDPKEPAADIPGLESRLLQAGADSDQVEADVIRLERAAATWEQARRSRDAAAEREIQAQKWGNLADACATAVGTLMDTAVVAFAAKVQKYLPATDRFALQLRDGEREVCRYGFLRELSPGAARLDIALSGAEWARLTAALAAALVESAPESALHVVIPDDRSWDAHTLVNVLTALEVAPAQVIVATTTEPARIPNGWTVIRTELRVPVRTWNETQTPAAPPVTSEDDLSDIVVAPDEGFRTQREDEAAWSPPKVVTPDLSPQGDYIAIGPRTHGVLHAHCPACENDRNATETRQTKTREERDRALEEKRAEMATIPRETLATTDVVKRGRGRPRGSKNKPKEIASAESAPVPAPTPAPTAAPDLIPDAIDLE